MRAWLSVDIPRVPGSPPPLRLHDTSSDSIRPTSPGSTARMYVCGITPYDATHLGHAATYLAFDLINRLWLDAGHDVHYVQNVTDIDDPLLERAERDSDDWVVLGMRETALFREDMTALRIVPPREFIGAVEAVDEISELVGKLLASGAAYRADDEQFPDVYHDHTATRDFGYVSRYSEARMLEVFPQRGGDRRIGRGPVGGGVVAGQHRQPVHDPPRTGEQGVGVLRWGVPEVVREVLSGGVARHRIAVQVAAPAPPATVHQ